MEESRLHRRQFNKLTAAALGGMMAGSIAGCDFSSDATSGDDDATAASNAGKHLCRGLNECKGQGAGGKNDCRGMGACATYAHHSCGGQNECKGQGGCGETAGANACKGEGGCDVPLMDEPWEKLRTQLVEQWKKEGKEFHEAPPKPMESSEDSEPTS